LKVLSVAIKAVPAVGFALGLAGIAAAASIIGAFVGTGPAAIVTMVSMLVGMVALYLISVITTGGDIKPLPPPAALLLWAVTVFICTMLSFLTTAVAFGWPDNFAQAIGVKQTIYAGLSRPGSKMVEQTFEGSPTIVPTSSTGTAKVLLPGAAEIVRVSSFYQSNGGPTGDKWIPGDDPNGTIGWGWWTGQYAVERSGNNIVVSRSYFNEIDGRTNWRRGIKLSVVARVPEDGIEPRP
jgi:hypothetical protein